MQEKNTIDLIYVPNMLPDVFIAITNFQGRMSILKFSMDEIHVLAAGVSVSPISINGGLNTPFEQLGFIPMCMADRRAIRHIAR